MSGGKRGRWLERADGFPVSWRPRIPCSDTLTARYGPVAESADAADLKSASPIQKPLSMRDLEDGSGEAQRSAQRAGAQTTSTEHADADLDRLAAAWPTLPEPIRRAMLAMIDSTSSGSDLDTTARRGDDDGDG